jgi:hypothetical protein
MFRNQTHSRPHDPSRGGADAELLIRDRLTALDDFRNWLVQNRLAEIIRQPAAV